VFVGGGAVVMKNFGSQQHRNISYIVDVKANAKGFEYLGNISLQKKQREG
jgi:plasmid segregation protein ParM